MATPKYNQATWAPGDEAVVVDVSAVDQALSPHSRAIYVGGTGDIVVTMSKGLNDVKFQSVPAGTTLAVRASAIKNTGTTATKIVALW